MLLWWLGNQVFLCPSSHNNLTSSSVVQIVGEIFHVWHSCWVFVSFSQSSVHKCGKKFSGSINIFGFFCTVYDSFFDFSSHVLRVQCSELPLANHFVEFWILSLYLRLSSHESLLLNEAKPSCLCWLCNFLNILALSSCGAITVRNTNNDHNCGHDADESQASRFAFFFPASNFVELSTDLQSKSLCKQTSPLEAH